MIRVVGKLNDKQREELDDILYAAAVKIAEEASEIGPLTVEFVDTDGNTDTWEIS